MRRASSRGSRRRRWRSGREEAEDECADGAEQQRQCERERDRGVGLPERLADRGQRHDDEEKIECVERPAEEAGGDGGVLVATARTWRGRSEEHTSELQSLAY